MKLQCGVVYKEGKNASGLDLALVLGRYNVLSAETAGEFVDGPLAMVYRGDRVTVEEEREVQPVRCGAWVMTWDGRLDNRTHIAAKAGLQLTSVMPDAELVARAHAAVGDAILDEVVGEYALTAWCSEKRELLLARSICGTRPLYYMADKERILWSSDFAHIVRTAGVQLTVDDKYMLEYLFLQPSARRTPLAAVKTVPPGALLRICTDGSTAERSLWEWDRIPESECRSDEEYERRCMALLCEAVEVRLRSRGIVFAELSGGLDSSTVVVVADKVLKCRSESVQRLQTVSCVFEESTTADERGFIRAVESWRRVPTTLVSEADQRITLGLHDIEFTGLPNPLHCFPGRYGRIAQIMREAGAKVLLTGVGGDHLFWSDSDGAMLVADELRKGRLGAAHRLCRTWSRIANIPYVRLLFEKAVPLLLSSLGAMEADHAAPTLPTWLAPRHRKRIQAELRGALGRNIGGGQPSKIAQRRMGEDLFQSIAAGYYDEYRSLHFSHPFAHRPLVEFCVAAPLMQFLRDGNMRSLMRRALRDVLPPSVLKRRSKPYMEEVLTRAARRESGNIGDPVKWRVCQMDYVEPKALRISLDRMRLGVQLNEVSLLRVLTLERWLRSLDLVQTTEDHMIARTVIKTPAFQAL